MIPLRDNVPRSSFPFFTLAIIAANCVVFLREFALDPQASNAMIETYALIPARTAAFLSGGPVTFSQGILPVFTSMFLHGGWMHLIGNMWFLWIFGDNVEDRLGHLRFLLFYMAGGLAGALAHLGFSFHSPVPTVGASGAIAAVMGAYLITFPRARVLTLVPLFFFFTTMEIPAFLILVYWLLLQFLSGMASLSMEARMGGGVAWFAHIGGFVAGIPLMLWLRRARRSKGVVWR